MTEQIFLNIIYPGISSNPSLKLTRSEFDEACNMMVHKKPSKRLVNKAIELGIIK